MNFGLGIVLLPIGCKKILNPIPLYLSLSFRSLGKRGIEELLNNLWLRTLCLWHRDHFLVDDVDIVFIFLTFSF